MYLNDLLPKQNEKVTGPAEIIFMAIFQGAVVDP